MLIYVAEDEPLAAAKLKLFLEKLGEGQNIVHFSDGKKLLASLNDPVQQKPDLLFMDIQMPQVTGIDVLKQINGSNYPIILTTAYENYAIDGFNYGVTDYLLKPYTLDRLKQAIQKAKTFISVTQLVNKETSLDKNTTLTIRSEGRNERVEIDVIECLEAVKDYTRLYLNDGRQLMTLGTLSSFEQQVPEKLFIRIQRSYIINQKQIQSYNSQTVRLLSGLELPIGKTYKDSFLHAINAAE